MEFLRAVVQIVYIGICVVLSVIVLKQEGKETSLSGALTGGTSESYWSKNKGRSAEGLLARLTKILAALFIVLSVVLNLNW